MSAKKTELPGRRETDQAEYRDIGVLAQAVDGLKELILTKFEALEDKIDDLQGKQKKTDDTIENLRDNHFHTLSSDMAQLRVETNQKLNRQERLIIISLTIITLTAFGVAVGRAMDLDIIGLLKGLFL